MLLDTPHEQAWREALDELLADWGPLARAAGYQAGSLTTARYQHAVAGRPRLDGARAGLQAVGVADPDEEHARVYAETKQRRLVDLIEREPPAAFDDAIALLVGLRDAGLAIATDIVLDRLDRLPPTELLNRLGQRSASESPVTPGRRREPSDQMRPRRPVARWRHACVLP